MWSDLTLGSSCKVKRWLIGFDELSFWWIQFASVLRMLGLVTFWFRTFRLLGNQDSTILAVDIGNLKVIKRDTSTVVFKLMIGLGEHKALYLGY